MTLGASGPVLISFDFTTDNRFRRYFFLATLPPPGEIEGPSVVVINRAALEMQPEEGSILFGSSGRWSANGHMAVARTRSVRASSAHV